VTGSPPFECEEQLIMRANRVREAWAAGRAVVNGWCGIPSGFSAELMAHMGWDSLVIDMQHGVVDYKDMLSMLQGISTTEVTPMVRVPWNDPAHIMKALDAGAYGIICPMINSREECEKFVGACRYSPAGYRSSGPIRAALYGGSDYQEKANDTVIAFAMIETVVAIAKLDEILSTPGLDAVYVGPSDLSITMGLPAGLDKDHDAMIANLKKILDGCRRHGVSAGIHTGSPAYAKRMFEMGYNFATVMGDAALMRAAGTQVLQQMRDGNAPAARSTGPY
jgi:4-hydroxy-2-oxoheptanedioate aldolase